MNAKIIFRPVLLAGLTTLALLTPGDQVSFTRLQQTLGMTAGNLSTHNRRLEEAGYLEVTKVIEGRSPVTYLALTDLGRAAFAAYRKALIEILAP